MLIANAKKKRENSGVYKKIAGEDFFWRRISCSQNCCKTYTRVPEKKPLENIN